MAFCSSPSLTAILTRQEDDKVEVTAPGEYSIKDGKEYIRYTEYLTENDILKDHETRSTIIIHNNNEIEVIKSGEVDSYMLFSEGERMDGCYKTPFGSFEIGVKTNSLKIEKQAEKIKIEVQYSMQIFGEDANQCSVRIQIENIDRCVRLI